ncbi:hypothetical protein LCGC14_2877120, partial [marine sediment metagenome]
RRPDLVKVIEAGVRAEISEEVKKLMEDKDKIAELEGQVGTLTTERDDFKTKAEEGDKARAIAEAQAAIKEAVEQAELPEAAKAQLVARYKDAETAEGIAEAIQAEKEYIGRLSEAGKVKGLGGYRLYEDRDAGVSWAGPLVVLTSKFSASASEILAGAIQDYNRGLIVGDHATHGKGTVQSLMDISQRLFGLPNARPMGALKITVQQFYRPNGESTQNRGVVADLELPSLTTHFDVGETDLDYPVGHADEYFPILDCDDPETFGIKVLGSSMTPAYHSGDVLIFFPSVPAQSGQDCFVRFSSDCAKGHGVTFKRVEQVEDKLLLIPLNQAEHDNILVERTDVDFLCPLAIRIEKRI